MSKTDKNDKNIITEENKEQERLGLEQALNDLREISMDDLEKIAGGNQAFYRSTGEW